MIEVVCEGVANKYGYYTGGTEVGSRENSGMATCDRLEGVPDLQTVSSGVLGLDGRWQTNDRVLGSEGCRFGRLLPRGGFEMEDSGKQPSAKVKQEACMSREISFVGVEPRVPGGLKSGRAVLHLVCETTHVVQ